MTRLSLNTTTGGGGGAAAADADAVYRHGYLYECRFPRKLLHTIIGGSRRVRRAKLNCDINSRMNN